MEVASKFATTCKDRSPAAATVAICFQEGIAVSIIMSATLIMEAAVKSAPTQTALFSAPVQLAIQQVMSTV